MDAQNQQEQQVKTLQESPSYPPPAQYPYFFDPYYTYPAYPYYIQPNGYSRIDAQVADIAIQTDISCFKKKIDEQSIDLSFEQAEQNVMQFPLPNKQKLYQLFQINSNKKKDIFNSVNEMCSQKTKLLNQFYKSVGEKILQFKKTKEEVIKFLVRRTWKRQDQGPSQSRVKYYSEYKSMNSEYLSSIFKEVQFLAAYEKMLSNFDHDFDKFNEGRFNRFYQYFLHCYINNKLTKFKESKECKSKLPYPVSWRQQIHETALRLYDNYKDKGGERKKSEIKEKKDENLKIKSEDARM